MRRRRSTGRYYVTGPRADERKTCDTDGAALSLALTYTEQARMEKQNETHYARDFTGATIGYAESSGDGALTIVRRINH